MVQNLFRDAVDRVIETEVSPKKGEAREYSSFWEVAKAMQKRASRARSRAREATRARVVNPLPVFFDKDGRTGAWAVWWRDAFAVSAALDGDGGRAESAAEESDLGHAARATLFFAQDMSRELLYDLRVATHSLSFWEVLRDRPRGQARFLLFNTGPRNFTERFVRVLIAELSSHAKRTKGICMAFRYLPLNDAGAASSLNSIQANGTNSVQ